MAWDKNITFRMRRRDWSELDEEEFNKKLESLKDTDMSEEECAEFLGMNKEDALDYISYEMDKDPDVKMGLTWIMVLYYFGLDLLEAKYIVTHTEDFSKWLSENYHGEELDMEDIESQEEARAAMDKARERAGEDVDTMFRLALVAFLNKAEITEGQAAYIGVNGEKFVAWVHENYEFPGDLW